MGERGRGRGGERERESVCGDWVQESSERVGGWGAGQLANDKVLIFDVDAKRDKTL